MNILHIGKYHAPFSGGIENTMWSLMLSQVNSGHEVFGLVHWHEKAKNSEEIEHKGIYIWRMQVQLIVLFVPISLFAWYYANKLIRHATPDVLHLHMPNVSCFWLLLMPIARKIPWIIHWHADVVGEKPDWRIKLLYPVYRLFEQRLLKRAAKIIVTSPNYRTTSDPLNPWLEKCVVVPLGINLDNQLPIFESEQSYDEETLNVLCIGRLTYYKGHQYLIDAISLAKNFNVQLTLDIVGDGDLLASLKKQVSQLGMAEDITFHGTISDEKLDHLINHCGIVCLPSIERTEAFGLVLLEAMRAKKACVVTDVKGSGMSYVVEHLKTGLVVEHSSAEALAQALMHCADHPQHLIDWGNAGYERLQHMFSLPTIAAKVEDIYHQVLAPHDQSSGNL